MATRTIVRKGDLNNWHEEFTTSGIFSPGHLLMRDSNGYVKVHDTAGGQAERLFAKELGIIGKTVDDAAASGQSLYPCHYAQRGDIINARVAASAIAIVKGDKLVSAGDGTLKKALLSGDKVYSNVADSTAIVNTSASTAFDAYYTLPANFLAVGDVINIRGHVLITTTTSTDAMTLTVKIGSASSVLVSGAPDSVDNDIVYFNVSVTIRTLGASGTWSSSGFTFAGTPRAAAGAADIPSGDSASGSSLNTTAANDIKVFQQWSAASGALSTTLKNLVVEMTRTQQDHVLAFAEDNIDNSAGVTETFIGARIL